MRVLPWILLTGCSALLDLDGYSYDEADAGVDATTDSSTDSSTDTGPDVGDANLDAPLMDAGPDVFDANVDAGLMGPEPKLIAAGEAHTCAIRGGEVYCWGSNDDSQSGISSGAVPAVGSRDDAVEVGAGETHTCARYEDGAVRCWGSQGMDTDYRLGSETPESSVPVDVLDVPSVPAIHLAVGHWYSCAAFNDGRVFCWGQNASAELGSCCDEQPMAIEVPMLGGMFQVAAGNGPSCALGRDGMLVCWGFNPTHARLGTGVVEMVALPAPVVGDLPVQLVAAGGTTSLTGEEITFGGHICATSAGSVYCWGRNDYGQVGNGSTGAIDEPELVNLEGVVRISAGGAHSCAVRADGSLFCWGNNEFGQLGDGTITNRTEPVMVTGSWERVVDVAAGARHTCAIDESDTIWCWGANEEEQLGSSIADSAVPIEVSIP